MFTLREGPGILFRSCVAGAECVGTFFFETLTFNISNVHFPQPSERFKPNYTSDKEVNMNR